VALASQRNLVAAVANHRDARLLSPTVLTTVGAQVFTIVSGTILARSLGPAERGDLALVFLWPTLLAVAGGVSVSEAVTFLARSDDQPSILPSAMALGLLQSLAFGLVGVFLLPYVLASHGHLTWIAMVYLTYIPILLVVNHSLAILQGILSMTAYNLARLSPHAIYTSLLLLLGARSQIHVETAAVASLISQLVPVAFTTIHLYRRGWMRSRPRLRVMGRLLRLGGRLHIGNLATSLTNRVDILVLSLFASSSEVGLYVVATTAATAAWAAPGSAALFLYPAASHASPPNARLLLVRTLLIGVAVSTVAAPLFLVLVPWAIPAVFGGPFRSAQTLAAILVVGQAIRTWNLVLTAYLRGRGEPLKASIGEVIGVAVLAVALMLLVPQLSAEGAAIAVCVAAPFALGWLLYQVQRIAQLRRDFVVQVASNDWDRLQRQVTRSPDSSSPPHTTETRIKREDTPNDRSRC
jgi:O-antigen/teichoic acid export membrane protein